MNPPNLRQGICCYTCKYGESDIRCGCYCGYYCKKYGDGIGETSLCDEYEGEE